MKRVGYSDFLIKKRKTQQTLVSEEKKRIKKFVLDYLETNIVEGKRNYSFSIHFGLCITPHEVVEYVRSFLLATIHELSAHDTWIGIKVEL